MIEVIIDILLHIVDCFIDIKPFRFEKFKNSYELEKYLNKKYPVNSELEKILNDLEKVGASFYKTKKSNKPQLKIGNEIFDKFYAVKYLNKSKSAEKKIIFNLTIYALNKKVKKLEINKFINLTKKE